MAKALSSHPTAFLHYPALRSGSSIRATHHRHQGVPEHLFNDAFPLSSHLISSGEGTALLEQPVSTSSSTQVFEAVAPDASLLIGMGSVVLLCIVAGFVWANEVVPVSRTKLAISKSRGEVREYLDELSSNNSDIDLDPTVMTTEGMDEQNIINQSNNNDMIRPNVGDGRDFERWLFSDWLNNNKSKGVRQKEPALPILKQAKWNSGDNPVLVTAAIMMLGVVVASVTERIAS
jgi:hypothetical protein